MIFHPNDISLNLAKTIRTSCTWSSLQYGQLRIAVEEHEPNGQYTKCLAFILRYHTRSRLSFGWRYRAGLGREEGELEDTVDCGGSGELKDLFDCDSRVEQHRGDGSVSSSAMLKASTLLESTTVLSAAQMAGVGGMRLLKLDSREAMVGPRIPQVLTQCFDQTALTKLRRFDSTR
jgi:hypothetical protein